MKSIRSQMIGLLVVISLLLVAMIYGTMHYELARNVIPLNTSITQKFVDNRTSEINSWFGERLAELRLLADLPQRREYTRETFFHETNALTGFDASNYISIRLVSDDGISHSDSYPDFSIEDRSYYQRLLKAPQLPYTVSNLVKSKEDDREAVIILYRLSQPLPDGTTYLAAAVPLKKVQSLAKELSLYDGKGVLLGSEADAIKVDADKELLLSSSIPLLPKWKVNYIVEKSRLGEDTTQLIRLLLVIAAIVSGILGILLAILLRQIIRPIEVLGHTMEAVQAGDRQARGSIEAPRELAELSAGFNSTLDRVYASEENSRKAAVRVLQDQIQPHFLYNTLDTIQWQILGDEPEAAVSTIEYLSTYYRKGLNQGQDQITLEAELEHVASYLAIQKIRHEQLMAYRIEVPEELLPLKVLHFILQPLIENAINHGIRPLADGNAELLIQAALLNDEVLQLTISNNGVPLSKEKSAELNDPDRQPDKGYGIYNVRQRLQLYYHGEASLSFQTSGNWTKAIIQLPLTGGKTHEFTDHR